jgi:glutamine synthetase
MVKTDLKDWFEEHRITEVECLVPDITGIPRGKIMPAQKFFQGGAPRLPEAIFIQSVTGEYPEDPQDTLTDPAIIDIKLGAGADGADYP